MLKLNKSISSHWPFNNVSHEKTAINIYAEYSIGKVKYYLEQL